MSRFLIGLAAVWLFAGGFGSTNTSACGDSRSPQRDCKPCKRPDGTLNNSPNVTDLVLDKTALPNKPAPADATAEEIARQPEMLINVTTNAQDAENDVLDYYYVVSGGRIIGSGASVQWDLSGVGSGTYTITAKVDDSCGVCGKTITKTIRIGTPPPVTVAAVVPASTAVRAAKPATIPTSTVAKPAPTKAPTSVVIAGSQSKRSATAPAAAPAAPPAPAPSSCSTILITDPERSGTDLIFTTKIFDSLTTNRLTYIWTVTGGTVVSQDKGSIRIKPGILGGSVKVSVNGLDPKGTCPNSAQKTF